MTSKTKNVLRNVFLTTSISAYALFALCLVPWAAEQSGLEKRLAEPTVSNKNWGKMNECLEKNKTFRGFMLALPNFIKTEKMCDKIRSETLKESGVHIH